MGWGLRANGANLKWAAQWDGEGWLGCLPSLSPQLSTRSDAFFCWVI